MILNLTLVTLGAQNYWWGKGIYCTLSDIPYRDRGRASVKIAPSWKHSFIVKDSLIYVLDQCQNSNF
jgi:hypothetical protein